MKFNKVFVFLIVIVSFFTVRVNASSINQTCYYSYTTSSGTYKYKIKVSDVDSSLLTDTNAVNAKSSSYWNSHIERYAYDYEKSDYVKFNDPSGCSNNTEKYQTDENVSICILTVTDDKKNFFLKGLDGNGGLDCPSMLATKKGTAESSAGSYTSIYLTANEEVVETFEQGSSSGSSTPISIEEPNIDISTESMTCSQILGTNLTKLVKLCITIARVVGAIIALLQASFALIPAINSGDAGDLKKAGKKCIYLTIILVVICLLPTFLKIIADVGGFDLTCFA